MSRKACTHEEHTPALHRPAHSRFIFAPEDIADLLMGAVRLKHPGIKVDVYGARVEGNYCDLPGEVVLWVSHPPERETIEEPPNADAD